MLTLHLQGEQEGRERFSNPPYFASSPAPGVLTGGVLALRPKVRGESCGPCSG